MKDNENIIKEARLVFNCGVCRELLKRGCTIIDVKPDRSNAETGKEKTVFVFKNDQLFQQEFEKINKEISEFKASHKDDSE